MVFTYRLNKVVSEIKKQNKTFHTCVSNFKYLFQHS